MTTQTKIIIAAFFALTSLFAQNQKLDLAKDGNVLTQGLLIEKGIKFLVTDKGFMPVNSEDPWQDYYRMIYKDTTITNPNTLINHNSESNFVFFPAFDIDYENFYKFPENSKIKDFFSNDLKGKIYFMPERLKTKLETKTGSGEKK